MLKKPTKSIEEIFGRDGRYPLEAVQFVREGLNFAVERFYPGRSTSEGPRHVSGRQLCEALLELARNRWGLMAFSVLHNWNIRGTRDFGEIVFLLVDHGWMQKQPTDSIDDFDKVFDFAQLLQGDFSISQDE
ncbi:MAG: hypothetical protein JW810_10860 [Sedimentisphaerales bacterium]|nr:hypothetical protein [Sedimentisphaerales bacterium]